MSEQKVVGYFNGSVTEDEITTRAKDYDDVIFAFWVGPEQGAAGAATADTSVIQFAQQQGKRCILSVGGSTYTPDVNDTDSATAFGQGAAKFALENGYQGVDFDIENIQINEDSLNWIATATNACANADGADQLHISHAPQGPYFTGPDGYAKLETLTNGRIDAYYIQYYNQGTWGYQSYEDYDSMFGTTWSDGPQNYGNPTSLTSINQQGVPAEKLYVGKPVTSADAGGSGNISAVDLEQILRQANSEMSFGGVMGWCIDSDTDGSWGATMKGVFSC